MYMLPWIRVYNSTLLLQQQEILGLHIRKGKSYSSTWLGSSEAPSRTSDGRDEGSNPREGICFRVINGYNFVTTNRINKPDSLIERAREAL